MTMKSTHDSPILVTGAAGDIGAIGRNLTAMLLAKGHKVRALVRREDERAEGLRQLGAEVVQGDLTDLASMHRAIEGLRASISECRSRRLISKPRSTSLRWRATTVSRPS
jgi:nucleoside-diphosphate-sugar epimerase